MPHRGSVIPSRDDLRNGANALTGALMGDQYNPGMSTAWDAMKGTLQAKIGDRTNFRPGESKIGSAIHHPMMAFDKALEWLQTQTNTAAGMPMQNTDEGSIYQNAPLPIAQNQAALNLAGTAELGGMPMAPRSAGGTLGTMTMPERKISQNKLMRGIGDEGMLKKKR